MSEARIRVLIAEEEPQLGSLLETFLSGRGCTTVLVRDGRSALERLLAEAFDVAIVDIVMPELDGLDASRQIVAKYPTAQRPRIVAMTANAMQGDREECLDAGMDDYVVKPIRVDALVEALQGVTHRREA